MSVYKCHAFIFLDQPPPWPSRTIHVPPLHGPGSFNLDLIGLMLLVQKWGPTLPSLVCDMLCSSRGSRNWVMILAVTEWRTLLDFPDFQQKDFSCFCMTRTPIFHAFFDHFLAPFSNVWMSWISMKYTSMATYLYFYTKHIQVLSQFLN